MYDADILTTVIHDNNQQGTVLLALQSQEALEDARPSDVITNMRAKLINARKANY